MFPGGGDKVWDMSSPTQCMILVYSVIWPLRWRWFWMKNKMYILAQKTWITSIFHPFSIHFQDQCIGNLLPSGIKCKQENDKRRCCPLHFQKKGERVFFYLATFFLPVTNKAWYFSHLHKFVFFEPICH